MSSKDVSLHDSLEAKVRATVVWLDGVTVDDGDHAYRELLATAATMAERWQGCTPSQVEGVEEARRLYRDFGVDPTRTRPSSEALLRRALKGLDYYHVNNVVDWGNCVSLRHLLSLGLYDAELIEGDAVSIRVGEDGEEYEGIRKGMVHVGGRLCVADAKGAFGSPTSDSLRTSIRDSTPALLAIVFAPIGGDLARLQAATDFLVEGFARHAGATLQKRVLLSP